MNPIYLLYCHEKNEIYSPNHSHLKRRRRRNKTEHQSRPKACAKRAWHTGARAPAIKKRRLPCLVFDQIHKVELDSQQGARVARVRV